jgi:hypothetical protein
MAQGKRTSIAGYSDRDRSSTEAMSGEAYEAQLGGSEGTAG